MSNDFASFGELPQPLMQIAIEEGEARLQAQLTVANAADQRAISWARLHIATITASLGAAITLIGKSEPDYFLAVFAVGFALCMIAAAWTALTTVKPSKFSLPGNDPECWLPEEWNCTGDEPEKLRQARIEQARDITNSIHKNREAASRRAELMHRSYDYAMAGAIIGGAGVTLTLLARISVALNA